LSANLMSVENGERIRGAVRPAVEDEGYDVAVAEKAEAALTFLCAIGVPGVTIADRRPGGSAERDLCGPRTVAAVPGLGHRLDAHR
jgi:DNA-binding NtrC family response regulator